MGQTALRPLRKKACWGFFRSKFRRLPPGANPWTWVPKASTLPLDHRSRFTAVLLKVRAYGSCCYVAGWVVPGVSTGYSAFVFMVEQLNRTSRTRTYCVMGNSLPPPPPPPPTHTFIGHPHIIHLVGISWPRRRNLWVIRNAAIVSHSDTKSRPRRPES